MNASELLEFKRERRASPAMRHFDVAQLACYGCAHGASGAPPPGRPSGERPCCSCIRNPERERDDGGSIDKTKSVVVGDDGHARDFDPFDGAMYNGAPRLYFPMDNYVTLDSGDQDRWLDDHPEYRKPVRFVGEQLVVVGE